MPSTPSPRCSPESAGEPRGGDRTYSAPATVGPAGLEHVRAIAQGTLLDLLRRPGTIVGALALGALLAMLPRLGNPAAGVRDNASLAAELTLSTLHLVAALGGGLLAISIHRPGTFGLAPEILGAPVRLEATLGGRWIGIVLAVSGALLTAGAVGSLGWWGTAMPRVEAPAEWAIALVVGLPASAALGAALGTFAVAVAPPDLAAVAYVAWLALCRWGATADPDGLWRAGVPDPLRFDVSREIAFGRPVGAASLLLGAAAAGLQSVAAILAATAALRLRISRGRS